MVRCVCRHDVQVLAAPWVGAQVTLIESARPFARHWHDSYGIGLLERGAHRSSSGQGRVEAWAGDVITHNPGEVHDGTPLGDDGRRWRMLQLEPAVMTGFGGAAENAEIAQPVIRDRALATTLRSLFKRLEHVRASGADRLACEESLLDVCARLIGRRAGREPSCRAARHEALTSVRERLADARLPAPTLDDLAVIARMSKFRLLRCFERSFGVPPHAWLLQLRAERARHLIARGATLAQAAADCGFADQSHMTRVFRRQFGYTPGVLRRVVVQ